MQHLKSIFLALILLLLYGVKAPFSLVCQFIDFIISKMTVSKNRL